MTDTRRKPTIGRQSPSLFDKWHGIFYLPNRTIDTAVHTKAFIYPVLDNWWDAQLGETQSAPAQGRFEPPTCQSTVEHANHQTTSQRINYTPGPQQGGGVFSLLGDRLRKHPHHL